MGFYIPEDDVLHNHHRENLKFYIELTGWTLHGSDYETAVFYNVTPCGSRNILEDVIVHNLSNIQAGLNII
jgi:hypothetical protein